MSLPSPRPAAPPERRAVIITPEADDEASAALAVYRAQGAGLADAFDADLAGAYHHLAVAPLEETANIARRRVGGWPFAVVYVVEQRRVVVAALVRVRPRS